MTTGLDNSDLPKAGSEVIDTRTGFMTRAWYTYFRKLPENIQSLLSSVEDLVLDVTNLVPKTRTINTTAPLSGGGDLAADLTLTHDTSGVTAASYTNANITVDAKGHVTAASNGSGGGITALTGDVTASGSGSVAATIANDVVTYAKMQNVSATSRILGRKTAGAGDTEECTLSEVLDFVGSAAQGDILYRNGTVWTRLPAGTATYVLSTNGAGANPAWVAPGAATVGVGAQIGYAYTTSTTTASTTSVIPADDTIPQNTEGAAFASLDTTITPTSASSLLEVEVTIPWASATTGVRTPIFALFRDSGANAIFATFATTVAAAGYTSTATLRCVVTAGSTSATTFKLRFGTDSGGTVYLNQYSGSGYFSSVDAALMTIKEIKQ